MLRILRLYDVPVLGARLLASDLRYGDMDDEFVASQALAVVGLVVFGFGLPVLGTALLWRHSTPLSLASRHTRGYFGALYDGHRVGQLRSDGSAERNLWFWELLVVVPRKMLLAMVVALVSQPVGQAALLVLVLTCALVLQMWLQPYTLPLMNSVESAGLASLVFASLGGLMLLDSDADAEASDAVQWALLVMLSVFAGGIVMLVAADFVRSRRSTAQKLAEAYGLPEPPTVWWLCGAGWCVAYGRNTGAYLCFLTVFGLPKSPPGQAAGLGVSSPGRASAQQSKPPSDWQ